MAELLVTTALHPDGSTDGLEVFETDPQTARNLRGRGVRRMGRPARGVSPPRRLSLSESATPEQRTDLALAENPYLRQLCGSDARPSEGEFGQSDDAMLDQLDQLAERVAARLGRDRPSLQTEAADKTVEEALPADAPSFFRTLVGLPPA